MQAITAKRKSRTADRGTPERLGTGIRETKTAKEPPLSGETKQGVTFHLGVFDIPLCLALSRQKVCRFEALAGSELPHTAGEKPLKNF